MSSKKTGLLSRPFCVDIHFRKVFLENVKKLVTVIDVLHKINV